MCLCVLYPWWWSQDATVKRIGRNLSSSETRDVEAYSTQSCISEVQE